MKNITDKRPHIVVATTAFAPFIGGAEVAVQEIIRRTSSAFRYTVVTARLDKKLPAHDLWNDVEIVRVGWGTSFDKIWLIIIFPWYARKLQPKLVWAIMASYAGAAACLNKVVGGCRYVLTLQEGDDLGRIEHRLRFLMPLFKQIFLRAESIHTIARFLATWAKKMGAVSEPVVIPNGVSCEAFSLGNEKRLHHRTSVREEYKIPENAFVILSVSRLVEKNGISDLIDALKIMSEAHLLLIGDGNLRVKLEEQSISIRERIHFLGTKQQSELKEFAAAADVFCRPALSEGQGIAFLEAECLGLPIVATNVGGIPEIIEHNVHGLLVEPQRIDQLVKALISLVSDAPRRAKMAAAGMDNVGQYSWNLLVPQIKNWLSSYIK